MRFYCFCLALAILPCSIAFAGPIDDAITYQGDVRDSGEAITGTADFRFRLFDDAASGSQIGSQLVWTGGVEEGRFSVDLDFGPGAFDDQERWLEIDVRFPAGSGSYTTLSPRQRIAPTPVALFALEGNEGPEGPQGPQGEPGPPGTSAWSDLTGVPSGFADDIDDDTTYSAGSGLDLSGTTLSVDFPSLNSTYINFGEGAGGDLYGSYPSPLVGRIRGRIVSSVSPSTGDVMRWTGSLWTHEPAVEPDSIIETHLRLRAASLYQVSGGAMESTGSRIGVGSGSGPTGTVHVFSGGDVGSLNSNGYIVLGSPGGDNIALDSNEIMARNGASTSDLNLNVEGGDIILGADGVVGQVGIGENGPTDRLHVSANPGESALRVQVGGTTRLRVGADGGVAIGSNNTSVGAGNLAVAGDITADSVTVSPTTRWLTLSAADFNGASVNRTDNDPIPRIVLEPTAVPSWRVAAVHLPHGAVVTAMYGGGWDHSDNSSMTIRLIRTDIQDVRHGVRNTIASVGSGGGFDEGTWTDSTVNIFHSVVDNVNYHYIILVNFGAISDAFDFVRVSYTVDSVLP